MSWHYPNCPDASVCPALCTVLTWVAQVSVQKGQCVWLDVVCCVRDMDKYSDKESISYFTK